LREIVVPFKDVRGKIGIPASMGGSGGPFNVQVYITTDLYGEGQVSHLRITDENNITIFWRGPSQQSNSNISNAAYGFYLLARCKYLLTNASVAKAYACKGISYI
jgi:hypothetical protein